MFQVFTLNQCATVFLSYDFFFNHTAATAIYTLSLHDALPISRERGSWKPDEIVSQIRMASQQPVSAGHVHWSRSEEHTSELQSHSDLVCRLLLEKKKLSPLQMARSFQ